MRWSKSSQSCLLQSAPSLGSTTYGHILWKYEQMCAQNIWNNLRLATLQCNGKADWSQFTLSILRPQLFWKFDAIVLTSGSIWKKEAWQKRRKTEPTVHRPCDVTWRDPAYIIIKLGVTPTQEHNSFAFQNHSRIVRNLNQLATTLMNSKFPGTFREGQKRYLEVLPNGTKEVDCSWAMYCKAQIMPASW